MVSIDLFEGDSSLSLAEGSCKPKGGFCPADSSNVQREMFFCSLSHAALKKDLGSNRIYLSTIYTLSRIPIWQLPSMSFHPTRTLPFRTFPEQPNVRSLQPLIQCWSRIVWSAESHLDGRASINLLLLYVLHLVRWLHPIGRSAGPTSAPPNRP